MSKYWVEHEKHGCPIGGPFDLWRQNYFMANGQPPEDTTRLRGPSGQLAMAHAYFMEWRKSAPFMPDSMQDIPRRWRGTEPEPLDDFLDDWRSVIDADKPTE